MKMNKCNTAHNQNQRQKSHDHLNAEKAFYKIQNSTSFDDKNSEKFRNIIKAIYDRPL
jgi:hypothetical protein